MAPSTWLWKKDGKHKGIREMRSHLSGYDNAYAFDKKHIRMVVDGTEPVYTISEQMFVDSYVGPDALSHMLENFTKTCMTEKTFGLRL